MDNEPQDTSNLLQAEKPKSPISELKGKAHYEIKEKVDYWHSRMVSQLYRFNTYADFWRLIKPPRSSSLDGFANPQVTETTRATEAIATFVHRALTSAQPNFSLLSHNPLVTQDQLYKSECVLAWQQQATQYNRKLLKGIRSCSLFGTLVVEQPFVVRKPYYEATDFVPRSLLQVAFDPLAMNIESSGWHAFIDFVTEDMLKDMAVRMPDVFDGAKIEEVCQKGKQYGNLTPEVVSRLAAAGYYSFTGGPVTANVSHIYYMVTYYGPLEDNPLEPGKEWTVTTVNDLDIIRAHPSVYKRRPIMATHLNEFELESYGYGVGRIAEQIQPELNSNRGRMHDTITYSLFNMWLASRMANIKTSQLRIKPWGVVETDDAEGLKPIRPQLEGVNFGIQLENLMKNEFRATTGATDNLQAMVTEATATESSIAQSEAVRRLSVISEIMAESLVREHLSKCHENNQTFLDQAFYVANTGPQQQQPLRVFPSDIAPDAQVIPKVVTDKDFRPQRNKDLLQFMQIITSIRSQITPQTIPLLMPFIQEFARGVQVDPKLVTLAIMGSVQQPMGPPGGAPQGNAMDQVGSGMQAAETVRSQAGDLGAAAHGQAMSGLAQAGV